MADANAPLAARLNYAQCCEDGGILGEALVADTVLMPALLVTLEPKL